MAKGLKTLIRVTRFTVDEKRRILTALQDSEDQVLAELARDEERMKAEQRVAAEDAVGVGFSYAAYHRAWMQRRANMEGALAAIRQQIEAAQDELAEIFRQLKTLELTQENREKKEREELARKEQIMLDEIGQNLHRRREAEEREAQEE